MPSEQRNSKTKRWIEGFADPPTAIDVSITDACDLQCRYCPLWGENGVEPDPCFMDSSRMFDFIDSLVDFHPSIRLIGGETMLHPDWDHLVVHARERGMWCTVVSNGIRLEEMAEKMVRSGLLAVGVSVDGIGEVNDCNRGTRTYERIRHGLEALTRTKRRFPSEHPWLEIYTTIHRGNSAHLVDFALEISTWGIRKLRLQHLIWCSSSQYRSSQERLISEDPGWTLFGDERAHVIDGSSGVNPDILSQQLGELCNRDWPFELEILPSIPVAELGSYHTDKEYLRGGKHPCRLLDSCAYVGPSGILRPCLHLNMGNVFERPFLEVWNNQRFRAFRRLIRFEGRLPICQRCPD